MLYTCFFQDYRNKTLNVQYYDDDYNRRKLAIPLDTFTYYTPNKKESGSFKDIWGTTYDKQSIPYNTMKGTREFFKEMDNVDTTAELFMNTDRKISKLFKHLFNNKPSKGDIYKTNIGIFDIETRISENSLDTENSPSPIVSIALTVLKENITYLFAYHKDTKYVKLENCEVIACADESEMIMSFVDMLHNKEIDILSGWNCLSRLKNPTGSYDIPYLVNRMRRLGLNYKTLSPYGVVDIKPKTTKEGITFDTYFIRGIQILDYMDIYFYMTKKETRKASLDYISYLVLKKNKVDYDGNLNDLYDSDIQKFLYYNSVDCTLIAEMDKKLGYFQSYCATGWKSDTNFEEVVNTNIFIENFFHKAFTERGFVFRDTDSNSREKVKFEGAFVYANVKAHKFAVNNDFNSMYPWLIIMFNISPETKVLEADIERLGLKKEDLIRTPLKGVYYRKDIKGIVPQILEDLYNERLELKAKMNEAFENGDVELGKIYHSEQLVVKIILNSCYGYFGFYKAKYYDLDNARVITTLGQDLIKYSRDIICDYLATANVNPELIKEFGNINESKGEYEDLINEFKEDLKDINTVNYLIKRTRLLSEEFSNTEDFEKEIVKSIERINTQNMDLEEAKKEICAITQIVDIKSETCVIDTDSVYMSLATIFNSVTNNNWKGLKKDLVLNKKTNTVLKWQDASEEEKETMSFVNFADKFYDYFDVYVEDKLDEWGDKFNTKNLMVFGREKYMRQLISIAKKKYIMDVAWDDGAIKTDFNLKYTGFELTKTDTTLYAKEKITDLIRVIFDGVKNSDKFTTINGITRNAGLVEITQYLDEMKKTFKYEDKNKIAMYGRVNKFEKYCIDDTNFVQFRSRTPWRLKASMYHNKFMRDRGLTAEYRIIENAYKVCVMPVSDLNSYKCEKIAWSGDFPEIYDEYFTFDYTVLFEKTVIPIVTRVTDVLGWKIDFDILNDSNIFNAF